MRVGGFSAGDGAGTGADSNQSSGDRQKANSMPSAVATTILAVDARGENDMKVGQYDNDLSGTWQ